MGDVINQSPIWKFVGRVSAITGVVCFGLSSTYDMSFGKLGYGGPLVYLFVCSFMWWLMIWGKRIQVSEKFVIWGKTIQVSEKFKGVVGAILFVLICSISVVYEKYVPEKSDAYTSTSYGSFALMSVSLSRKLELGFETGFSAFFLKLFAAQLLKIKWFLLPIALVFCSLVIILYHYPESRVIRVGDEKLNLSPTNNQEVNEAESSQAARQDSPEMGEVSGQRLLSTSNELDSQEESSQAGSPSGSGNIYWIELVLTEGRDLSADSLFVIVRYGNMTTVVEVKHGTINPKWNPTFEFPDDGSPLVLYVMGREGFNPTLIGRWEVIYQKLPLSQMAHEWISLKGGSMGEIHIQITRKVLIHLHQIPTQGQASQDMEGVSGQGQSTIQNVGMHSYTEPELISVDAPGQRRRQRMTPATQSISSGMAGSPSGSGNSYWIELVLIEGRDLFPIEERDCFPTSFCPIVAYGPNMAKQAEVKHGTINPKWNQTFEFLDDGSVLYLCFRGFPFFKEKYFATCEVEYQQLPPNQMDDKWISLKGNIMGEIHIQITRKVPQMQKRPSLDAEPSSSPWHHKISTQIKEMVVKFRSLIEDRNIKGLPTALSELEMLGDRQLADIDMLEALRMNLLGEIEEYGHEKVQIKEMMVKIRSLGDRNIEGLSTALSELEMLRGTLEADIDKLETKQKLLLSEIKEHGQEKVQIKEMMVQIRSLIEGGNIKGLSTALNELEMLGGTLDQLETERKLLLGEMDEHYQEKLQIEEMKVKFRSLIKDGNIEGLSTALSELEMGLLGKIKEHGQEKVQVSSEKKFTIENVGMHSYTEPEFSADAEGLRRRRLTNIQNKQEEDSTSSSLVPGESEHNII